MLTKHLISLSLLTTAACAYASSPYIANVFEYRPAPGQFVNDVPEYEEGDTEADMLTKAAEQLCGDKMPGMVSLGAFGGYVVFGFDHPVANVIGQPDLRIYGNTIRNTTSTTAGSSEPGVVMVMADENHNGLPDDTWYEIAGCKHSDAATKSAVTITYTRPAADHQPTPDPDLSFVTDMHYIAWQATDGTTGYVEKNRQHTQSYWPLWLDADRLTFSGTMLPPNAHQDGNNFELEFYPYGYADAMPNDEDTGIDISSAVDSQGNPAALTHINFVKVYTGVNQTCGWLGETSTEICGAEDLHPTVGIDTITSDCDAPATLYTLDGQTVTSDTTIIPKGIYIERRGRDVKKVVR